MFMTMSIILFITITIMNILLFLVYYPKTWQKRKLVFGVQNREEYKTGETLTRVDSLAKGARRTALFFLIAYTVICAACILLTGPDTGILIWTGLLFFYLVVSMIPFVRANGELKSLKKELGIHASGTTLVDLGASEVRALRIGRMVPGLIVTAAAVLAAFFIDAKIIHISGLKGSGDWIELIMTGAMLIVGVILLPCAIMMDHVKNIIISRDSDVNANYNRARKKNFADIMVWMNWGNAIFTVVLLILMLVNYSEMMIILAFAAYVLLYMAFLIVFVRRAVRIEARYEKENGLDADDDDHWLGGLVYYNPNNKRLNVEKRNGLGGTVNLAHPVGKVITGVLMAAILFVLVVLVYMGALIKTPLKIRVENGYVICHQLKDEYKISIDSIEEAELLEDFPAKKAHKRNGVGMDKLLKGNFSVDGEKARLMLNPKAGKYIRIETDHKLYYISAASEEETEEAYQALEEALNGAAVEE